MPFALPEYDQAFSRFVSDIVKDLATAQDAFLSGIRAAPESGTASSVVQMRGEDALDLPGKEIGFGLTMNVDAVRTADFDALVIEMGAASDEYASGLADLVFSSFEKVTASTGNVVDAGGQLKFEHLYEMLDKREWSLNEDDELEMPSLVMHPDTVKNLPTLTAEQDEQLAALKARKHEELLARRRRRRLS